jgi:hypothetical protein
MLVAHVTRIVENYFFYNVKQCGLVVYLCFGRWESYIQDRLASSANRQQAKPLFADPFQGLLFDAEEGRRAFFRNVRKPFTRLHGVIFERT